MLNTDLAATLRTLTLAALPGDVHEVSLVTNDSRRMAPNGVFCAISGATVDGHHYVDRAIANGAKTILQSRALPKNPVPGVQYWQVSDDYHAYAAAMQAFYGFPDRQMNLTAVTGTNGKTTTVLALRSAAEERCGVFSTVEISSGSDSIPSAHTTPEAGEFFRHLSRMAADGCREVYLEASSHALAQHRLGNIQLAAAIFTNLTGDHLDYHKDLESYYQAKKRLFTEYLAPGGLAIIHLDAPGGERLAAELQSVPVDVHTFGTGAQARHRVKILHCGMRGSEFEVDDVVYSTNLTGDYNVANLSGVILAKKLRGQNVPQNWQVPVPGRLERFDREDGATVFVDFAHTDDALSHVLTALRPLTRKRLIVLFGAGGDRDRTKRPRMGRVAAQLADVVILTSDNPRSEEPEAILDEIAQGIPAGKIFERIADRAKAIEHALDIASSGDTVLIAGKGHEKTQEIGDEVHPFDDCAEVRRHFQAKTS